VVDVKGIPELGELDITPRKGLTIGAAVTCKQIYEHPEIVARYPGVVDSAAIIGGIQIQGRATFGGNVCNSSPSGDSLPMLIAYSAECHIAGPDGKRRVPVAEFCTGPGANVLRPGELLVAIRVPLNRKSSGCHYLRFIPRNEMDIAVVGVGAYVELGNRGKTLKAARIGLGAVAPTPLYAAEASEGLTGQPVSDEAIAGAAEAAQSLARPITDMRGPAEYRQHLVGVLTTRALRGAIARARGEHVANAVADPSKAA
jgi:carbon-monoxide dehydrogenase medium subunit